MSHKLRQIKVRGNVGMKIKINGKWVEVHAGSKIEVWCFGLYADEVSVDGKDVLFE